MFSFSSNWSHDKKDTHQTNKADEEETYDVIKDCDVNKHLYVTVVPEVPNKGDSMYEKLGNDGDKADSDYDKLCETQKTFDGNGTIMYDNKATE